MKRNAKGKMAATETGAAFWEWFEEERRRRRLSYRAVEAAGGARTGWLQKRINEGLPPNAYRARAIAAAFNVPLEEVMRRAGLLPESDERPELAEVTELARRLSPENLDVLRAVARALAQAESQVNRAEYYRIVGLGGWTPTIEDWKERFDELTPEEREEWLRRMQEWRVERNRG